MEFDDKNDNSENNENKILKKELEIISEEKNINCSEENTNNKFNKTLSKNKSENKNKNLKYSPKYLRSAPNVMSIVFRIFPKGLDSTDNITIVASNININKYVTL